MQKKMDHGESLKRVKSHIQVPTKVMEEHQEGLCKICDHVMSLSDHDQSLKVRSNI